MDYKLHKVSSRRGRSNIKSPEWLTNKKATINPRMKMMMNVYGGQQFLH